MRIVPFSPLVTELKDLMRTALSGSLEMKNDMSPLHA